MADPDEALALQLFAEMNGLRGRRRGAPQAPTQPSPKRHKGSESSSASPPADLHRGQSGRESAQAVEGLDKRPSRADAPSRQLKRLHKHSSLTQKSATPTDLDNLDKSSAALLTLQNSGLHKPVTEVKTESMMEGDPQKAVALRPSSSWTEQQAYAAAAEAIDKARQAGKLPNRTRFKCFCNGIPWGLALPPEALQSRKALALALEQGYEDEDLQLEAGKRMHVILVDNEGQLSVYPPQTSDELWAKVAPEVTRAYVCQA